VPGRSALLPVLLHDVRTTSTLARMERVDAALRVYFLSFGDYPSSLEELLNATPALVAAEDLSDAAGVPLLYDRTAQRVALAAVSDEGEPYLVFVHQLTGFSDTGMGMVDPSRP